MGMSGIDEKAMMLQALEEVAGVTKLPLSIDSSHVDVQEEALRRYPGRALINSISLESKSLKSCCRWQKNTARCLSFCRCRTRDCPKI